MKKFAKIISLFLVTGVLLTACERIDIEGIGELNQIELWYSPYSSDAAPLPHDSVLIDHVEKDLGISLVTVPLPSNKDEQTEMIMEAARTNSLPDIFMVNRDVLSTLVKENKVARVDSLYPLMPERTAMMYDETARLSSSFDGVSYGLSQSGSVDRNEGILIRKDWLDKLGLSVPVTIDDFYNVMKAFTVSDPDGDGIANTYGYGAYIDIRAIEDGLGCRFAPFFGAFGVEGTFNASKSNPGLNIHKPEYLQALEYLHKLVEERVIDPGWATYSKNDFRAAWKAGRFGMMREQNAAFALESNYKDFDEKYPYGEWILINPPVGPEGKSSVGAYAPGYRTYAVSRRAQELGKLPVIARLLEWMSTDGYTIVAYGEEAVNYMLNDEGKVTTEGLPNPDFAYTQKAAAPLLQLRNLVFYNSNEELESRYPTWHTKTGKEMSAFKILRQMQKCPWTLAVNIPGISKELKDFYEDGVRDFVSGRLELKNWTLWLKEFDEKGGADWERRCLLYAEENSLLLDDNKRISKD
ncbi:extracellular solute-binding protein [Treponema sp. UBA3813]|uniref:extracellular solute-binding protein n=1 Tax=Treponema sp. UBA3813 TaxID=1947715 RepID=UPI0025D657AB|nr:extracellular solute-binding protein [Treponema sp. UBA3813]